MSDETTAHDDLAAVEHNRLLVGLLGGGEPEQTAATEAADESDPEFDGGAREPAPEPEDPEGDHNRFVAEFARMAGLGGGL